MTEFTAWYPVIRSTHIALVLASGGLFALRGALLLAGQGWVMAQPWRLLSYGIDTLLLTAGVTLWAVLSLDLIGSPWLGTKLLLLLAYIALGSLALKRARTPAVQRLSYAGACLVYLFMASVALAHHPLGLAQSWVSRGG